MYLQFDDNLWKHELLRRLSGVCSKQTTVQQSTEQK